MTTGVEIAVEPWPNDIADGDASRRAGWVDAPRLSQLRYSFLSRSFYKHRRVKRMHALTGMHVR